jgi:hypothetical protein
VGGVAVVVANIEPEAVAILKLERLDEAFDFWMVGEREGNVILAGGEEAAF